jgi:hypothetical protein
LIFSLLFIVQRLKEELNAFSLKIQKEQQELRNADGKRLQDILKKEEESRKSDTMVCDVSVFLVTIIC